MNRRPSHDMDERISLHVLHRGLLLQKTQEPGMSLSRRQWDRHLDRIRKCKEGWNVLWLAAATTFFGVAVTALFTAISIPLAPTPKSIARFGPPQTLSQLSGSARNYLFLIAGFCALLFLASLAAYLTRRKDRDGEIEEIIKDMRVYEPEAPPPPPPPLPPIRREEHPPEPRPTRPDPGESVEKGA